MYKFKAYGHENITAKHKTTLEFTKDEDLSLKGDCIVGVNADFNLASLKKFIKKLKNNKIRIIIKGNNIKEEITAEINPDFNSDTEMVIRKSDFKDKRTFAINSNKSSKDLDRNFTEKISNDGQEISIEIRD